LVFYDLEVNSLFGTKISQISSDTYLQF